MAINVTYHPGSFIPAAAAQNKAEEWNGDTGLYTAWDPAGVQVKQRALTAKESADLAAVDTSNRSAANGDAVRAKASQALITNGTFLALASPTNAQTLAQVKALTKENNAIIRLLIGALDDVSDT